MMNNVFFSENISAHMEIFNDPKYCLGEQEVKKKYLWTSKTSVKSNHGNEALTLALQGMTCSYHNNNNNGLQLNAIAC